MAVVWKAGLGYTRLRISCTTIFVATRRDGRMNDGQIYQAMATVVSILAVVVPFLWKTSRAWTVLEGEVIGINKHLNSMEKDLDEMKRGLVEARSGRTNLWNEVNVLKERNTRLSTIVQLKSGEKCPQ